jgi:hypothetical protein
MELPQSVIVPGDLIYFYHQQGDENPYLISRLDDESFHVVHLLDDELVIDTVTVPGIEDIVMKSLLLSDRILIFGQEEITVYHIETGVYDDTSVRYSFQSLRNVETISVSRDFFCLEYWSSSSLQRKDTQIVNATVSTGRIKLIGANNNLYRDGKDVYERMLDGSTRKRKDLNGVLFFERRGDREVFILISDEKFSIQSTNFSFNKRDGLLDYDYILENIFYSYDPAYYKISLVGDTFYITYEETVYYISLDTREVDQMYTGIAGFIAGSNNFLLTISNYSEENGLKTLVISSPTEHIKKLRIYGVEPSPRKPLLSSIVTNRDYKEGYYSIVFESEEYENRVEDVVDLDILDSLRGKFLFVHDPLLYPLKILQFPTLLIFKDLSRLDKIVEELPKNVDEYVVFDASTEQYH